MFNSRLTKAQSSFDPVLFITLIREVSRFFSSIKSHIRPVVLPTPRAKFANDILLDCKKTFVYSWEIFHLLLLSKCLNSLSPVYTQFRAHQSPDMFLYYFMSGTWLKSAQKASVSGCIKAKYHRTEVTTDSHSLVGPELQAEFHM